MTPDRLPQVQESPRDPFPQFISPMLVKEMVYAIRPEEIKDWIFEPKWNGVRGLLYIPPRRTTEIKLLTRTGRDIISNFPEIYKAALHLQSRHNMVLDGEIVSNTGRTEQERMAVVSRINNPMPTYNIVPAFNLVVFDAPYLDDRNLCNIPLLERKRLLDRLFSRYPENIIGRTRYAATLDDISRIFDETASFETEGLIAKKKTSPYRRGKRSSYWQKAKFNKPTPS